MSEQFVKGYTNNHLTWAMVDATDFATPESALSAATKIKIWGKLKGATGVNFVNSGAGSMTNDIQHVGPSVLGIYTIALAKADLSDASAAWYDQYIISLSATGAAYQVIIADGGIMQSYLSAVGSDILSAAVALSDATSNAYSAAVVGSSRILLVQSRLSDFTSAVYPSDISDIRSMLTALSDAISNAYSAAVVGASRILLVQSNLSDFTSAVYPSDISDIRSMLTALSDAISNVHSEMTSQFVDQSNQFSYISNIVSGLGAGASASAIADKVWSDFGSKVGATPSQLYSVALIGASAASDAASAAAQANSRVLLIQSRLSDYNSVYTSDISDIRSMLTALSDAISNVDSAVNSQYSDIVSKLGNVSVAITASDISDIASAVAAGIGFTPSGIAAKVWSDFESKAGASPSQVYSVLNLAGSRISDTQSYLVAMSGMLSDTHSAAILAASHASDAHSAALLTQSMISDVDSALTSQFALTASSLSDIDSAMSSQFNSISGMISDVDSALSSQAAQFTFTVAGKVDANITHVIADPVQVNGASDTNWGGAP